MPLAEHEPCSSISNVVRTEGVQPKILSSRTVSFSKYTDLFREVFQTGPDTTFLVYNPSSAFINPPNTHRAVRVDCSDGRTKSVIFTHTNEGLEPYLERIFDLEDPFASSIDDEIVFGGVEVDRLFNKEGEKVSRWRTILYRGTTIPELRPFFTGPEGMKDIRLVKRPDGKIGVYTRPRNLGNESLGGNGQIGYREFESLDQMENADPLSLDIENAPLLSFRFPKDEWGGVNHVQVVRDGRYQGWNLLLIHRAYRDTTRHYYASALLHDPQTGRIVDLGTLVKRSDIPPGPWKGQEEGDHELEDVFFPGELIIEEDRLRVIGGAGDAEYMEVEKPIPLELST